MKLRNIFLIAAASLSVLGNSFSQEAVVQQVVEPLVQYTPNYAKNLQLFYGLIALTAVLLFAIGMVAYSIKTLLASDYYKERLLKKSKEEAEKSATSSSSGTTTLLSIGILGFFMAMQSNVWALSFQIEEGDQPWLRIENSDLLLLLTLNCVLVGVLLYMRRMFKQLVESVQLESEKKVVKKAKTLKKINRALTDTVPIEHEEKITLDHEYDGIQELDNNLPPWWVFLFFATIAFSVIYMFHYHILGTGDLQIKEYKKELKQAEIDVQEYLSKMAMNVDETNATVMEDESDLSTGKSLFVNNCAVCHLEKGEGNIGPNLTDDYWLTAGDIKTLFRTIKFGTANGMPEHASKLNPIQIQQVASFVYQLPFVAGKEPEGEKFEEKDAE